MRVRTLIATADTAYTGHISDYISEHHADTMEISVCNDEKQLSKILEGKMYDVALMDAALMGKADLSSVNLPLLLWADEKADGANDSEAVAGDESSATGIVLPGAKRIRKHKRISLTIAEILEQYAAVTGARHVAGEPEGSITAVWSPCGGAGKTAVALAYAASKAAQDKEVFYLNLEHFATTAAYFDEQGKSISAVFEMLEGNAGNAKMLISGIHGCENGIKYLCAPDNYDDICILSPANIRELVSCCSEVAGELVVDLSCYCDARTQQAFELADKVLLVTGRSQTEKAKLAQFVTQGIVYEGIRDKTIFVVNKNTEMTETVKDMGISEMLSRPVVMLPCIEPADERYVYKMLARELTSL